MIPPKIKKYMIAKLTKPAISLSLCIAIFFLLHISENIYYGKYMESLGRVNAMRAEVSGLSDGITQNIAVRNTWQKIEQSGISESGLRVQRAREVIELLRKENMISNLNVTLSNPVLRQDLGTKIVSLEYSQLDISMSAYIDTEIFKFIDGVNARVPGIINYSNLTMKKLGGDINQALFNSIKTGGARDIVQAKISIVWQDFIRLKDGAVNAK